MFAVFVTSNDGEQASGFVYDVQGRETFWCHTKQEVFEKKNYCEVNFGHYPEQPKYKVVQLVEVE